MKYEASFETFYRNFIRKDKSPAKDEETYKQHLMPLYEELLANGHLINACEELEDGIIELIRNKQPLTSREYNRAFYALGVQEDEKSKVLRRLVDWEVVQLDSKWNFILSEAKLRTYKKSSNGLEARVPA